MKCRESVVSGVNTHLVYYMLDLHFLLRSPPSHISVTYDLIVDTDETDHRLELLHKNVQKFGTIFNTVKDATRLTGTISRKE